MKHHKTYIFTFLVSIFIFISACKDGNPKPKPGLSTEVNHVVKIDCESSVRICGDKPGLLLSGTRTDIDLTGTGTAHFKVVPINFVICCSLVPGFLDTLTYLYGRYETMQKEGVDSFVSEVRLKGDSNIIIKAFYKKKFLGMENFFYFNFGDETVPAFFLIGSREEFDALIAELNERFRTCCL